jgi:hypothetical protein
MSSMAFSSPIRPSDSFTYSHASTSAGAGASSLPGPWIPVFSLLELWISQVLHVVGFLGADLDFNLTGNHNHNQTLALPSNMTLNIGLNLKFRWNISLLL